MIFSVSFHIKCGSTDRSFPHYWFSVILRLEPGSPASWTLGQWQQAFLSPKGLRSNVAAWLASSAYIRFDIVRCYDSAFKVRSEKILPCDSLPETDVT